MSKSAFKRASVTGGRQRTDVLASLHNAQLVESKPVLPAEIISTILDYLAVPDLIRFARVSKRMQEMVYDDTRWVQRLKAMGCWDEREAKQRFEDAMRKQWEGRKGKEQDPTKKGGGSAVKRSVPGVEKADGAIFNSDLEATKQQAPIEEAPRLRPGSLVDGFDTLAVSAHINTLGTNVSGHIETGDAALLHILTAVRSIRGAARQEYGKVYSGLSPYYFDISMRGTRTDAKVFRDFKDPEQQSQMLSQLKHFAKSDFAYGNSAREESLDTLITTFEVAVLREFEQALYAADVSGNMKKYACVLVTLNGGQAGVDHFIRQNPLFSEKQKFGNPMDCLEYAFSGSITLGPSSDFFKRLSIGTNQQAAIIDQVFPSSVDVLYPLLERVCETIVSAYITPLLDETHGRSIDAYLKAVAGLYDQSVQFSQSLKPTMGSAETFRQDVDELFAKVFEPHVDLYLQEELHQFTRLSGDEVNNWEKKLTDEYASTESYFMANVNRVADKRDFLSSFKKVVMMPVNVVAMPFTASKPVAPNGTTSFSADQKQLSVPNRSSTPTLLNGRSVSPMPPSTPGVEAITTELAAKAAIMATRLEGIRSLFSIEVALNLVKYAKSSLERVALFVRFSGQTGQEAKEQCATIFVMLLQMMGSRHIKAGFDKAVDHLSKYNAREVSEHSEPGVAPLVMFLELVSVGDLIQQMIDVFYQQELVAKKLVDANDFLDPAVKEKKRFEQMLDERVAAGLNKGIDVLMDEVEYLCATTQDITDFNPTPGEPFDVGPSITALRIVELVSSHTKMLVGSTDKNMLDVFNQEIGLRLFAALCKHLKRQRVSVDGSMKLISDMTHYTTYITSLRNADLLTYYKALIELAQIYLIAPEDAKDMATVIADGDRFYGVFRAEEVYEFAQRRADWYQVKSKVERAMYGIGCIVM